MQHLRAGPLVLPGVALHPVIMRGQILVAGPVQQLGRQDDRHVGRGDPACSGSRRAGTSPPARHHPSRVTGILSTPRLCTRQERITVPVRGNTPSTWRPSTSCYPLSRRLSMPGSSAWSWWPSTAGGRRRWPRGTRANKPLINARSA